MVTIRIRIEAVLLDAKYTIFSPRNMSRQELLARVVEKVTERKVDGEHFWRKSVKIRQDISGRGSEEYLNTDEYWIEVNQRALRSFDIAISDEQAREIHRQVSEETDLYTLYPTRRRFVEWLCQEKFRGRVLVVIASNSPLATVERLLQRHGIRRHFKGCYSPDVVGANKPSTRFFEKILARWEVAPEQALMVGNSRFNDIGAHHAGLNTVIIPDRRELSEVRRDFKHLVAQTAAPRFCVAKDVNQARRWIDEHFVAASVR